MDDNRIEDLVAECLRRLEDEGPAGLDAVCTANPDVAEVLRRRVRSVVALPDEEAVPEWIGPFRVLSRLGAGGMGVVYLAEQREPIRRRVAVKVIQPGLADKQVLARFELERQALALMSHECIAKVLDAGMTEQGSPFFVMEYVEGVPITTYCRRHELSVQARIELFQRVCAGVQHAHQKGVIHRDLKPGNVLVTEQDGQPVPKIIDFGLARSIDPGLIARTLFTEQGQLLGTLEYMSPEQVECDPQSLDTRTDVYALGVMLYELLSGQLPFSAQQMREVGMFEMQRRILEQEPLRPSLRVTARGQASGSEPRGGGNTRPRDLRGDLDWIVMRSLAKKPRKRYASASGLAEDLRRHLANEPVDAGPPSVRYRFGKLLRRHRVACIALFAAIVGSVAMGLWQWEEREVARRWRETQVLDEVADVFFRFVLQPAKKIDAGELRSYVEGSLAPPFGSTAPAEVRGKLAEQIVFLVEGARSECLESQRQTLWRILQARFGKGASARIPRLVDQPPYADAQQKLSEWCVRAATASSLDEVFSPR